MNDDPNKRRRLQYTSKPFSSNFASCSCSSMSRSSHFVGVKGIEAMILLDFDWGGVKDAH
jgi:hypothetical protein